MSNIVDELRDAFTSTNDDRFKMAADEIERLRALNSELLEALKHLIEGGYFEHEECDICKSLAATVAKAEAKPRNWEQSAPDKHGNRETIRERKP